MHSPSPSAPDSPQAPVSRVGAIRSTWTFTVGWEIALLLAFGVDSRVKPTKAGNFGRDTTITRWSRRDACRRRASAWHTETKRHCRLIVTLQTYHWCTVRWIKRRTIEHISPITMNWLRRKGHLAKMSCILLILTSSILVRDLNALCD